MKRAGLFLVAIGVMVLILGGHNSFGQRRVGLGLDFGAQKLLGDAPAKTALSPAAGFYLTYHFNPAFSLSFRTGYGELNSSLSGQDMRVNMIPMEMVGSFHLLRGLFSPVLRFGLGVFNFGSKNWPDRYFDGIILAGTGFDWFLRKNFGLRLTADYRFTTGDDFEGIRAKGKDSYLLGRLGMTYYFPTGEFEPREKKPSTGEKVVAQRVETKEEEDIYLKVVELKSTIDQLKGLIQKKDAQIEELKSVIRLKDQKIEALGKKLAQLQSAGREVGGPKARPTTGLRMTSRDFRNQYSQALAKFRAYNYQGAIEDFLTLLSSNPSHPLAGNCQYWIGESYFGLRQYQEAAQAFEKVLSYGKSPKQDDALLMAALAYLRLGNKQMARAKLEQLLSEFPRSEYTRKARRLLNRLRMSSTS